MKISVEQLRTLVFEAVRARLSEAKLQEGPKEIGIRAVMEELYEIYVGSLTEDITLETGLDEEAVEDAVSAAYEQMTVSLVQDLDVVAKPTATGPRRRIVGPRG